MSLARDGVEPNSRNATLGVGATEAGGAQPLKPVLRNPARDRFGAFSHLPFTVMWAATTCSLTGVAISDTASAWLMTNLNADPRAVSLVQVASSLPMFLFTLAAGALADLVEPRRFLIVLESVVVFMMSVFGAVVFFDWVTPTNLIATTFVLSACWSLAAPAWLSITPLLVPPRDLDSANAANSVGYNISRAIGPILAGLALAGLGAAAPYWIFGAADLASVAALIWWRAPPRPATGRPPERLAGAVQTGIRHCAGNKDLRSTLIRTRRGLSLRLRLYRVAAAGRPRSDGNGSRILWRPSRGRQRRRGARLVCLELDAPAVRPRPRRRPGDRGPSGGPRHVRRFARSHLVGVRVCARWRVLDHRPRRPLRLGAALSPRLGSGARARNLLDGDFRVASPPAVWFGGRSRRAWGCRPPFSPRPPAYC